MTVAAYTDSMLSTSLEVSPGQMQTGISVPVVALPPIRSKVRFHMTGNDCPLEAVVISRAGKSKGVHRNWLNVEYTAPESFAGLKGLLVFQTQVDQWETIDDALRKRENIALVSIEEMEEASELSFEEAKKCELTFWSDNAVFEEIRDAGHQRLATRWVLTTKSDGRKRLVQSGKVTWIR